MQEQRGGLGRGIQWPRMKGSGRRRSKDLAKIPGFILRTMGRHGEGFPTQGSISIRLTPYCVPYKSGWRRLWREAEVQVQGLPQGSGMQADEGGRAGAGGFGVPLGKRWQRLTAGPGTIRSASQGRTHFTVTRLHQVPRQVSFVGNLSPERLRARRRGDAPRAQLSLLTAETTHPRTRWSGLMRTRAGGTLVPAGLGSQRLPLAPKRYSNRRKSRPCRVPTSCLHWTLRFQPRRTLPSSRDPSGPRTRDPAGRSGIAGPAPGASGGFRARSRSVPPRHGRRRLRAVQTLRDQRAPRGRGSAPSTSGTPAAGS